MSTSSTSGSFFNGESTFSAQLNNVVSRAVARAAQPISLLQSQQNTLTGEQAEVQTLGNHFVSLQSAVDSLNSAASSISYTAAVSTSTVATASASSGALPGSYTLAITSVGSQTNTISAAGTTVIADPSSQSLSSAASFTLSVSGKNVTITPASSSLDALVAAINGSGANVQATVINVGGSANPSYRLSVQSTHYAPDTIQLTDGSTNLLTALNTGSYVTYQVNGQPAVPINSESRSLSISTGLTANVLTTGNTDIDVSASPSGISTALTSIVTAYNSANAEISKNRGQNGGALTGNNLILQLQQSLNSLGSYRSGTSGISALAGIGLTFDQSGNLSFDATVFNSAYAISPAAVSSFLGSESGGGFIQAAYSSLSSLTDNTNGTITTAGNNIGATVNSLTSQISDKQTQVNQLQTKLTTQMAQADSAISALQGQLSEITGLFSAENQISQNIHGVG